MSASAPGLARAWAAGQQAIASGDMAGAQRHLRFVVDHDPRNTMAAILMAGAVLAEGRLRDASEALLTAARHAPDDPRMLCRLAQSLLRVGEIAAIPGLMSHPALAACRDGATLATLAHVEQSIGRHRESLALMDRAAATGFDSAEFRYFRAIQLQFNGRLAEAETELGLCLARQPGMGRAQLTLSRLKRQTADANHLETIRRQIPLAPSGTEDQAAFEFALYKELEDLGDYDNAWQALQRGNRIMAARFRHDPRKEAEMIDRLNGICDDRFFQSAQEKPHAGPQPIFILGLPRSGTTLLETLMGRHTRIESCGELGDFPRQLRWQADCQGPGLLDDLLLERLPELDYAELGQRYLLQTRWRAGKPFYIDKLPPNYLLAGLIAKALPGARILHLQRDAMDVCFSNYRALFGEAYPYSYDLPWLVEHYRQYERVMKHWHAVVPGRILDVPYARLVTEPEATLRAALAHCGLDFEIDCLQAEGDSTPVATLSSAQVREPVHTRGLGLWRRYEDGLMPLARALSGNTG